MAEAFAGEVWTIWWTYRSSRYCIDFDRETSALRFAGLLAEARRELVYVDGPREIEVDAGAMAEVKRRVDARVKEAIREAAEIAGGEQ